MLYTMKDALSVAKHNNFAIPAFNISNFEMFQAVIESAEEYEAPVIIEIHPDELAYIGDDFIEMIKSRIHKSDIPVVLHLDHGVKLDDVLHAIRCGFTSVMIDGSTLPYEENIAQTKAVVRIAHALNVSVEAELGTIGTTGRSFEGGSSEVIYTDVEQAKDFVDRCDIDSLAVAIGTAHGLYPKNFQPKLNLELLKSISETIDLPLVLHGGSGNPDEEIEASIQLGICKVNISSDVKSAFFEELREYIIAHPQDYEPNCIFPSCKIAARKIIQQKLELLHTKGKSSLY